MSYPPPQDPYQPHRPPPVVPGHQQSPSGWPPQPPAKKRQGPLTWILGGVLVVLALCVGLTVIVGLTSDNDDAKRGAVAGATQTAGKAIATHPTTAAAGRTTAPSRAVAAATTKPKPTSAKPKPKPTRTATTKPEPTSDPTHTGVTAGAFCSEHGDYGLTSKGTLMRCKTSATDSRYRWRRA